MAKTTKDVFGGGYTTHGDDGKTYKTTKDVIGDGYTTHGSDGSTYKTTKNVLNEDYTTHKVSGPTKGSVSFDGVGGEIGGGIALAAIAVIMLQLCLNILSKETYIYLAVFFLAPKLSGLCERLRFSRIWSAGALFCFAAFGMINSFFADVSVVAGTKRGGEGLLVLIILFMILLVGIFIDIFSLGEGGFGFPAFFVVLVSIAWCYFNGFASIPYTYEMQHYSIIALLIMASIDQIVAWTK